MVHHPDRRTCSPRPARCPGTAGRSTRHPVRTPARTPLAHRRARLHGHSTPPGVRLLAQQIAEVLAGRRTPESLSPALTVPVREQLRSLRSSLACCTAPRLGRVFHQSPAPRQVEASAVVGCGCRRRAFAFRAGMQRGRWVCSQLETDLRGPRGRC